jgi:flagellar hook-length control protein FliK
MQHGQPSLSPSKPAVPSSALSPQIQLSSASDQKNNVLAAISNTALSDIKTAAASVVATEKQQDVPASNAPAVAALKQQSSPHLSQPSEQASPSASLNGHVESGRQSGVSAGNDIAGNNMDVQPIATPNEQAMALRAAAAKPKTPQKPEQEMVRGVESAKGAAGTTGLASMTAPAANANSANVSGPHIAAPVAAGAAAGNGPQSPGESKAQATASSNPFQRLDSGEPPATLLHANAREVTVGVRDPSLGWVEIQTQSSSGHVSASLTAASAEARASLAAEVPAITQYLADRNVNVHSLGMSTSSGAEGGGQQQSGPGHAEQEKYSQGKISLPETVRPVQGSIEDAGALETGRSSHISVRA